ncbi:sigma-70 family RNA polymerase sigma factor, partial [Streptomyces chartreusis]|uniref:sigma-70 family RNA polymerase sigma factor n=1 Tax=Streptomyces chartreusis TaxID=1969 RepID=UPI0033C01EEE
MAAVTAVQATATAQEAVTTDEAALPLIEDPSRVSPKDARELSRQFFDRLVVLEEGTHEFQYVRNTLIEMNLSLVRYAASRFRARGDSMEDVVQVGTIGLIKAIDRFEVSREVEFTTFAVPYIVGEIKRFFRDTSWAVHVPRPARDAAAVVRRPGGQGRPRPLRHPLAHPPQPG